MSDTLDRQAAVALLINEFAPVAQRWQTHLAQAQEALRRAQRAGANDAAWWQARVDEYRLFAVQYDAALALLREWQGHYGVAPSPLETRGVLPIWEDVS